MEPSRNLIAESLLYTYSCILHMITRVELADTNEVPVGFPFAANESCLQLLYLPGASYQYLNILASLSMPGSLFGILVA